MHDLQRLDTRRVALWVDLAVPVVVPLAMRPVFRKAIRRFGPESGYQVGFAVHWATCWLVPERSPVPVASVLATSYRAVAAAVGTRMVRSCDASRGRDCHAVAPHARRAGSTAVLVAAGVGITNALAEEALWRGLPVAVLPDDPIRGWLWPAAGFTAWHLVPLTARRISPRKRIGVLLGAGVISLGYGWIAQRTLSLAAVAPVHPLTDPAGFARPALSG